MNLSIILLALASVLIAATMLGDSASVQTPSVPLWGRWETTFRATGAAGPDTGLRVTLTSPTGAKRHIEGFWDGGETWKARFMPDQLGEWRFETSSTPVVTGLDGQKGPFTCRRTPDDNRFLKHGPVVLSEDRRSLRHADGTPFFWMGDTVWSGAAVSEKADWDLFLADRVRKRFNVIQFQVLAPCRLFETDGAGQVSFEGRENIRINPRYFQRLDERMDAINRHGILASPVMIWSLSREDPGAYLPEADCIRLARYQIARYGAHHLIWMLAGDNPYDPPRTERWKRIGRAVFGEIPHAPVTTHPTGMNWPWQSWSDEKWLDILGYQSGHGDDARTVRWITSGPPAQRWPDPPPRPIVNLEPPYEAHNGYQSKQPHSDHHVRRACYWSLLVSPTAGVTYGGHGVWSWESQPKEPRNHAGTGIARPWKEAMNLPGSRQMQYLYDLFDSIQWWKLRPDQTLLTTQPGEADPFRFVAAAKAEDGSAAVIYAPVGGELALSPAAAKFPRAEWFDPRTGARKPAVPAATVTCPSGQDWILLLRNRELGG